MALTRESVLSETFCMWGQKYVPENFVLKFYDLWGQFASGNSLPCSIYSVGTIELFHQSFFNTPFYIFIGLQNNVMYITNFVNQGHCSF